jgi:Protein of unknown function (DUF3140)
MGDTPADISVLELDALWAEFHRVVNMTSVELSAWLAALPADAGTAERDERGERVLAVLHKRRGDLTDADVATMYEVVDAVDAAPGDVDPAIRRGELMALGHDPGRA